jgi:diguanylate cyclase (GGDEF)-like protein
MFDAGGAAGPALLESTEYITVAGHTWTMVFRAEPDFEERYNSGAPRVIVVAGLGLGLLAALLAWQLINGRNHALAMAMKMTRELREGEERMRHMAQHDPLTHLPNRALFSDRLSQAIAAARRNHGRLALIFVDLDNFKPVNDSYGHAVGDLLLQDLARRLQACLRESDSAGRFGGDEFVVLLPSVAGAEDALQVAEKIRSALGRPMAIEDRLLQVSASIGVAVFPEHGEDEINLAKSADDAMYRAKAAGRDRVALAG